MNQRLTSSVRALVGCLLVQLVLGFQDIRMLGSGIQGWQIVAGGGLFLLAIAPTLGRLRVNNVTYAWSALFAYSLVWTLIAYHQTGGLWIGGSSNLFFGLSLLTFGMTLNPDLRRRWVVCILIGYFALNILAGIVEITLGNAALIAFHETKYSAGGRLRMLASEPSHIYAPFIVGLALLWQAMPRGRMRNLILIGPFLVASASKALLPVSFLAFVITERLVHLRKIPRHARWVGRTFILSAVGLVFLLAVPFYVANRHEISWSGEVMRSIDEMPVGDVSSFLTRGALFADSALVIARHPVLGVGPGKSSSAILSQAESTGLITPEILFYAQDAPNFITSKTIALDLLVNYGVPVIIVSWITFSYALRRAGNKPVIFALFTILIGAFVTQGYNVWAWLALCILSVNFESARQSCSRNKVDVRFRRVFRGRSAKTPIA